jgi:hypothetical protein
MKTFNFFTSLFSFFNTKKIGTKLDNIEILPIEKCSNSRYNYAECKTIVPGLFRSGIMYGQFPVMIDVIANGSKFVVSGRKEVVTSKYSKDGSNQIVLESPGKRTKYDTVIRFIKDSPAEHMYFLNGKYVLTREFTPSMNGGTPKDYIKRRINRWDDFIFVGEKVYSNKLEISKPLIKAMEDVIGKTLVDDIYYNYLTDEVKDEIYYAAKRKLA